MLATKNLQSERTAATATWAVAAILWLTAAVLGSRGSYRDTAILLSFHTLIHLPLVVAPLAYRKGWLARAGVALAMLPGTLVLTWETLLAVREVLLTLGQGFGVLWVVAPLGLAVYAGNLARLAVGDAPRPDLLRAPR